MFLRNHDELTLEMVTDEERDYMYRVYAEDPQARINVGIRRRLAPLLGNDRRLIEMMNGLLFSLPGAPVVYYGDEIGMGDNIYLGDRNGVRTPMQWDADRNAGFSNANPQRLYLPVVIDPEYHSQAVNVANQDENPSSLLWWMRRLIALRNRFAAFSRGSLEVLLPDNRKVLAFMRELNGERILVVVNLSRFTQAVELDLAAYRGMTPVELFGSTDFPEIGDLPYFVTLGGHGFYWFSLEDHAAKGTDHDRHLSVRGAPVDVLKGGAKAPLNRVLPSYLAERRWFRDKSRRIRSTEIVDVIAVPGRNGGGPAGHLAVVDVNLDQGLPETYVLSLAYAEDEAAAEIRKWRPESVVTELSAGSREGLVYDALTSPDFSKALLDVMSRRRRLAGRQGHVESIPTRALRQLRHGLADDASAVPISTEQSNTSVIIGNQLVLKVIRRLEEGINPDVEVGRYLTEQVRFPHSPMVGGSLEYRANGDDTSATIAVAQGFVPNEGEGWSYVLDAVSRVLEEVITHRDPDELLLAIPGHPLDAAELEPVASHPLIGPHLQWAQVLGVRTAQMHLALAQDNADPEFAPEPFTAVDRRSLHHGTRSLLRRSMRLARAVNAPSESVAHLLSREKELQSRLEAAMKLPIVTEKIRCHGDYHLGQVLWTGKDFVIIDFEGEPARPLSSRRLKRPALVDVAGMIRSFHYASRVAGSRLMRDLTLTGDRSSLEPLLTLWYRAISGAFLRSYLEVAGDAAFIPRDRAHLRALLDFLLLEKAIYELGYEADNRPAWIDVPAQGVLEILEAGR
jgi:maltose alpha-D-glucosyltransferase/alpha-amylase